MVLAQTVFGTNQKNHREGPIRPPPLPVKGLKLFDEVDQSRERRNVWKKLQCECKQENLVIFFLIRLRSLNWGKGHVCDKMTIRSYFSAWCARKAEGYCTEMPEFYNYQSAT